MNQKRNQIQKRRVIQDPKAINIKAKCEWGALLAILPFGIMYPSFQDQ
jgi:hypothetical protein